MIEVNLEDESDLSLTVDGIVIEKKACRVTGNKNRYDIEIYDKYVAERISLKTFEELPKELESIHLGSNSNFMGMKTNTSLVKEDSKFTLIFFHDWNPDDWKNFFSMKDLDKALSEIIITFNDLGIEYLGMDAGNGGFDIECSNINSSHAIQAVIDEKKLLIDEIYNKVSNLLIEQSRENAVVSVFDFPEQVRVPCEQYLIYFADFLRNLGIKATTDIAHEAGNVLFSVTPESKDIALQHIREALDIYLNLPGSMQGIQLLSMDVGIKEQQLLAQIHHLSSQISLANALTQSQRDTIQYQQTVIDQQQQVLDASILQQSLLTETLKNKTEDSEKILGGAISLTKYEGKGFHINIANIYRHLKGTFNKNE
ncbi:hypothetical protein [Paenibacillus alvei]|uniref:hypothetical protein n=1 Tax=Paenibacillus alvei TaxID=44250 RepID=UPI002282F7E9|nr:hypothetical protein [Paenibacillus alvei]